MVESKLKFQVVIFSRETLIKWQGINRWDIRDILTKAYKDTYKLFKTTSKNNWHRLWKNVWCTSLYNSDVLMSTNEPDKAIPVFNINLINELDLYGYGKAQRNRYTIMWSTLMLWKICRRPACRHLIGQISARIRKRTGIATKFEKVYAMLQGIKICTLLACLEKWDSYKNDKSKSLQNISCMNM